MSGEKIRKVEMNNEIVLLRQSVRQARICVINKLIREAKRLRNNHGNEKKLQKNKKKADKLLREVRALKLTKDDEISKYGISNIENICDVIQDSSADDNIIAIAKVVRYKSLNAKILNFKGKFPEYEEYFSSKKKKATGKKKNVKGSVDRTPKTITKEESVIDENGAEAGVCTKTVENRLDDANSQTRCVSHEEEKFDAEDNDSTKEASIYKMPKIPMDKHPERDKRNSPKLSEQRKESTSTIKVISGEATVKRFNEILWESVAEESDPARELNSEQILGDPVSDERVEDDFFLGSRGFLNIVEPDKKGGDNEAWNEESRSRMNFVMSRGKPKSLYGGKTKTQYDRGPQRWCLSESRVASPKQIKERVVKRCKPEYLGNTTDAVETENLHPSWAAKKKQQDIMKGGFQGKKIVFTED